MIWRSRRFRQLYAAFKLKLHSFPLFPCLALIHITYFVWYNGSLGLVCRLEYLHNLIIKQFMQDLSCFNSWEGRRRQTTYLFASPFLFLARYVTDNWYYTMVHTYLFYHGGSIDSEMYSLINMRQVKTSKNTEIDKQSDVNFWLDWIKYGAVSYSLSCKESIFRNYLLHKGLNNIIWVKMLQGQG